MVVDNLEGISYRIVIPSRARSGMLRDNRGVWKYVDKDKHFLQVYVREEEYDDYGGDNSPVPLIRVDNEYSTLEKRKFALVSAHRDGIEFLVFLDDDIVVGFRKEEWPSKYCNKKEEVLSNEVFDKMLVESIGLCCGSIPLVGFPMRQVGFVLSGDNPFYKTQPIIRFACYHTPTMIREGLHEKDLGAPYMCDRFFQLSLLDKGYMTITNARYSVDDSGTGALGGCQVTRTVDLQNKSAMNLRERFPSRIELKTKSNGSWIGPRWDCKIKWSSFLQKTESKNLFNKIAFGKILGKFPSYGEHLFEVNL